MNKLKQWHESIQTKGWSIRDSWTFICVLHIPDISCFSFIRCSTLLSTSNQHYICCTLNLTYSLLKTKSYLVFVHCNFFHFEIILHFKPCWFRLELDWTWWGSKCNFHQIESLKVWFTQKWKSVCHHVIPNLWLFWKSMLFGVNI